MQFFPWDVKLKIKSQRIVQLLCILACTLKHIIHAQQPYLDGLYFANLSSSFSLKLWSRRFKIKVVCNSYAFLACTFHRIELITSNEKSHGTYRLTAFDSCQAITIFAPKCQYCCIPNILYVVTQKINHISNSSLQRSLTKNPAFYVTLEHPFLCSWCIEEIKLLLCL